MPRITIADLAATLARIEARQEAAADRIERLEKMVETALTARDLVPVDQRAAALDHRVTSLEASHRWVTRSVIGAFITGLVGLVWPAVGRLG